MSSRRSQMPCWSTREARRPKIADIGIPPGNSGRSPGRSTSPSGRWCAIFFPASCMCSPASSRASPSPIRTPAITPSMHCPAPSRRSWPASLSTGPASRRQACAAATATRSSRPPRRLATVRAVTRGNVQPPPVLGTIRGALGRRLPRPVRPKRLDRLAANFRAGRSWRP
jgi:hypothetical protein